ncbi:MAG TPA: hypothetical protein VMD53_13415 [Rhizomicrobium sp.]|nr:hypothetical protein [Rhizomicrobium sp.]
MKWAGLRAVERIACAVLMASVQAASAAGSQPPAVDIVLERNSAGWTADYTFTKSAPVWFFQHSKDSLDNVRWRLASVKVVTPGVTLARLGNFDALYRRDNRPLRHVRMDIVPFSRGLRGELAPALKFSDGGLAFYSHQFVVSPLGSIAAVEALPVNPDWKKIEDVSETLTIKDRGRRLLLRGRVVRDAVTLSLADPDTYVYSGAVPLLETEHFVEVMDPGLPTWVRSQLDDFLPRLMEFYTDRLGAPSGSKPTAMIAWGGPERPGLSLGGSVYDGLVAMNISGSRMLTADPKILAILREFFGHETSHFWIGQTIHDSRSEEDWITEGSADLLGIRAIQHLVPGYDPHPKLQEEMNDCLKFNGAGKPLSTAEDRGDDKAQYACGALLLLAAEATSKRKDRSADALSFVRRLIDANRSDGEITEAKWLASFSQVAGPAARDQVQGFIDHGVANPLAFWATLFTTTGVGFTRQRDTLTLLDTNSAT